MNNLLNASKYTDCKYWFPQLGRQAQAKYFGVMEKRIISACCYCLNTKPYTIVYISTCNRRVSVSDSIRHWISTGRTVVCRMKIDN